jgi:hypothetical protein
MIIARIVFHDKSRMMLKVIILFKIHNNERYKHFILNIISVLFKILNLIIIRSNNSQIIDVKVIF